MGTRSGACGVNIPDTLRAPTNFFALTCFTIFLTNRPRADHTLKEQTGDFKQITLYKDFQLR